MPQRGLLSVDIIVEKLIDISKVIDHRMGIKAAEDKRIQDAFTLLAKGPPPANSRGLSKVVLCAVRLGPSAVANMRDRARVDLPFKLKEREDEVKNAILQSIAEALSVKTFPQLHWAPTLNYVRQEVTDQSLSTEVTFGEFPNTPATGSQDQRPTTPLASLTGDVYQLTAEDARLVAMSGQILGNIWLTDTYKANTTSFVTIPISDELTNQFTVQRPRVM